MIRDEGMFRRMDATGIPLLILRLLVGPYLAWYALVKIASPGEFMKEVHIYGILPEEPAWILNTISIVMPWIELLGGLGLLLGVLLRGSAAVLGTMLVVFTLAVFQRAWGIHTAQGMPFTEIEFDCGCGTGIVIIWKKLLTNTGLVVLCYYAAWSRSRLLCLSNLFFKKSRSEMPVRPTPVAD